jgi:hypothetical protein
MGERKGVINVLSTCEGDEKKMMNRVGKHSFSCSILESTEVTHSDASYTGDVVTDCLLFMNTAAASDIILGRKCHNLNSFWPQNLKGKFVLTLGVLYAKRRLWCAPEFKSLPHKLYGPEMDSRETR